MRWAALSAVLVAIAARLLYGPGVLGYDAVWALIWGDEIAGGSAPSFTAPFAPTPHPLANLVSAALSPLGPDDAGTVILALSWLSLGALAVALAWLGAELFAWPVGIAAAIIVCTRVQYVAETGQAIVDLPFLALAVSAGLAELRQPGRRATPILLVLAGLLRPEGWALGAIYLLYRRDLRLVPLLAIAPVLWAGMDLWAADDLLHSLHGTQTLGEALGRPTGADTAFSAAPAALRDIVQEPMLYVALAGAAAGLFLKERESAIPAAVVGVGLLGFMVLGVAGLPVLSRYLLLPATMLILFAGLALAGGPKPLMAAAAIVAVIGIPGDVDALQKIDTFTSTRHAIQADLRKAVRSAGCRDAETPDARSAAVARLYRGKQRCTVTLRATGPAVRDTFAIGAFDQPRRRPADYAGPYFSASS